LRVPFIVRLVFINDGERFWPPLSSERQQVEDARAASWPLILSSGKKQPFVFQVLKTRLLTPTRAQQAEQSVLLLE